jgi:aryl-alcohol dehydrogenase-like predicted oxidoreductase
MEYVNFQDLKLSRFCMGGCPMGGYGWGETNEQDFIAAIRVALENGVNFFDTANTYGFGQSEETLAKGIRGHRQEVVIQSKFGVRVMEDMVGRKTIYDNSPDYIRKALEGTLKRLDTDYIDIYTIHYRDRETPIEEVVDALEQLKKEGKVRFFGISNIHSDGLEELLPYRGRFATCQDEFSLACRKNEDDLLAVHERLEALPMTWGSLGQGILTGKYGPDVHFGNNDRRQRDVYVNFHGEKLKQNLQIVETMRPIAALHGKSCAATAIRFILDHLGSSIVTAGVKNVGQMRSNLEGLDWKLDPEELRILDSVSRA